MNGPANWIPLNIMRLDRRSAVLPRRSKPHWRRSSVSQSPKRERSSLATDVIAALSAGNPVCEELAGGGRLHIERRVPVLCVYRLAPNDAGTEQLLRGEPAYMVVPAGEHRARKALKLLRTVVQHLAKEFGSFLVVEIWSAPTGDSTDSTA